MRSCRFSILEFEFLLNKLDQTNYSTKKLASTTLIVGPKWNDDDDDVVVEFPAALLIMLA